MNRNKHQIECIRVTNDWKQPLLDFLHDIEAVGDTKYFNPHSFTEEEITRITHYDGNDVYYIIVENHNVVCYGFLRGWDEGFKIPSLGIATHPSIRNSGLGKMFMQFLHVVARRKGATQVRLRVSPDNTKAFEMYRKIGYQFITQDSNYLVGIYNL